MRSVEWQDGDIVIIDQTVLPGRLESKRLTTTAEVVEAIASLRVRGAPAIGIAGAFGVAQAAIRGWDVEHAARTIKATRPTAVNLAWAVDRVLAVGPDPQRMLEEALRIEADDEHACLAMAKHAQDFFTAGSTVMTHCNTGALCTGGYGTALGAIRLAHENGTGISVLHTETRPLLQGARLTAWELGRLGIEHAMVVDAAAPGLIARGEVSLVITGADRIAANGDVANKVGTYPLALAAGAASIPFVVVAPISTIDLQTPDGSHIEVEERGADEVTSLAGIRIAPEGTSARNPAFDVTPASLITAIVTERGVARPPTPATIAALVSDNASIRS